jgi:hypothetical protein
VGDTVTSAIPVPVNVIVCVAGVALSVITMLPAHAPRAVGVKVMEMTQFLPAATELPQVLVSAKSPLGEIFVTLRAVVVLVFVSVTVRAALVEPTATEPNERDVAESVTLWACASYANPTKKTTQRNSRMRGTRLAFFIYCNSPCLMFCCS